MMIECKIMFQTIIDLCMQEKYAVWDETNYAHFMK